MTYRYIDPLDAIWLAVARQVGLVVERSAEVFAATDGRGRLVLGTPDTLDPDDCLAQMVLHELCHWLVQGERAFAAPDWGLCNESERDVVREHACLRLQAWLTAPHGLRDVLAPTTDFRAYYDRLGDDPLGDEASGARFGDGGVGEEEAIQLARDAAARSTQPPWAPHLQRALEATGEIARTVAALAPDDVASSRPSLWSAVSRRGARERK